MKKSVCEVNKYNSIFQNVNLKIFVVICNLKSKNTFLWPVS